MDYEYIKENATESGDCGNGWAGWRLGTTLYIEYTGPLDCFNGDPFVPDDLLEIICWDATIKTETETLIIGNTSYVGLGLGITLFSGWSNLKRIDIATPNAVYGVLDDSDLEENYDTWNSEDHFDYLLEELPNLEAVNIIEEDSNILSEAGIIYDKERKTLLFCPRGRQGHFSVPAGVEMIEAFAFSDCRNLTSITVPDSVNEIGICAFDGCVNLSLTVSDSVTCIGSDAFKKVPHITYHGSAQSDNFWGAVNCN